MFRPFRLGRSLFLLTAPIVVGACRSSSSSPSPVLTGIWGGSDVALTVADTGTHVEFDCAHGDIPGTMTVTTGNEFDVQGTYVREHGGPIRVGEIPDAHPAAYLGTVAASTMALTVRLTDTDELIGAFTLARGSMGRVLKCLLPLLQTSVSTRRELARRRQIGVTDARHLRWAGAEAAMRTAF